MEDKKTQKKVEEKIDELDMNLDEFGVLQSSISVDKLNRFLDENVEDKKLKDRKQKKSGD